MKPKQWVFTIALLQAIALWPCTGNCQRMFLDTDSNGEATAADLLGANGANLVDVWVETNYRDAISAAGLGVSDDMLTINSYEFILRAEGGEVKWGKFTNHQVTMTGQIGPYSDRSDYYIAQFGMEKLLAGKYRLGTLEVTVVSGNPTLSFADRSSVWQCALTSFGSKYVGRDGDNTLKLVSSGATGGKTAAVGDWGTAVGLSTSGGPSEAGIASPDNATLQFGTRIAQNAGRGGVQLSVTTTKSGSLRVRLYDASGRLVRVLADHSSIGRGEHVFPIDSGASKGAKLSAAIYYFRVESPEGTETGKVAVVR